ncbi:hypothetical protein T310_8839, partial [Rasamsonia emersonii CBS 393.64]
GAAGQSGGGPMALTPLAQTEDSLQHQTPACCTCTPQGHTSDKHRSRPHSTAHHLALEAHLSHACERFSTRFRAVSSTICPACRRDLTSCRSPLRCSRCGYPIAQTNSGITTRPARTVDCTSVPARGPRASAPSRGTIGLSQSAKHARSANLHAHAAALGAS